MTIGEKFVILRAKFEFQIKVKFLKRFRVTKNEDDTKGFDYSQNAYGAFGTVNGQRHVVINTNFLGRIPGIKKGSVLSCGPRYTTEIKLLRHEGFKNVVGIDNFSYSMDVVLGDLHAMQFDDESFDNIICAFTISYSSNPKLMASEMERVTKKGGFIMVVVQYVPKSLWKKIDWVPGIPRNEKRIQRLDQFDRIFKNSSRKISFENHSPYEGSLITLVVYQKNT